MNSKPERLGPEINTPAKEFLPRISPDGNTLYFVRMGDPSNPKPDDQDIWKSERGPDGKWKTAEKLPFPINNVRYNAVFGLTPDASTLLLINSYERDLNKNKGLAIAHRQEDGNWGKPFTPVFAPHKRNSSNTSYFLANDGQTLLMEFQGDDTNGFQDLYVSFLQADSSWGTPLNLGAIVNTTEDEVTPFLASDMRTLYFGSAGLGGEGNMDLFVTTRMDSTWQNWSPPRNLGPPINTPGFDAFLSISAAGDYAYYGSSTLAEGSKLKNHDIFRVLLPPELRPLPVQLVSGRVLDAKTKQAVPAAIRYTDLRTGMLMGVARTDPQTGAYRIALPAGSDYDLHARAEGFAGLHERIDLSSDTQYREVMRDLMLTQILSGNELRLNNLFFATGSARLESASYTELHALLDVLTSHPKLKIEVGGHTDSTGSDQRNLEVSKARAAAVFDWLTQRGIDPQRIQPVGYGDTQPETSNQTPEGRALNRRVVCKILNDGK